MNGTSSFEKDLFSVSDYAKRSVLLLVVGSVFSGCREASIATGEGSVRVDGAVLNAGWVVFRNEKATLQGNIQNGGRYVLSHRGSANLPCGDYGVMLIPPEPENDVDPATGAVRPGKIPDDRLYPLRCRAAESSGVSHTIGAGHQVINIDFKSRP